MSENDNKYLILGIGNCGRQDDGLGWAFLDMLKENEYEKASLEYKYQLQIEDAELISDFDTVIFVDASKNDLVKGYEFEICKASNKYGFSTHSLAPETIMYLSQQLYNYTPKAFVLGIQGYEWELVNDLTKKAFENLNKALDFFNGKYANNLSKPEYDKSHN